MLGIPAPAGENGMKRQIGAASGGGRAASFDVQIPVRPAAPIAFGAREWWALAGFYGFVAGLHVAGWGLYLYYAARHAPLVGLGLVAYLLGLRHAFDADHIASIDDTVRFLLQKGKRPIGVGFFFSLGHSTIVLGLAVAIGVSATSVAQALPQLQNLGGIIGASISGAFLWLIGILNLLVLLGITKVWRQVKAGAHDHDHLNQLLAKRGLINRLFGGRLSRSIGHSWQMYPLGLLFGLGFDTASEIGLLAMTAGASAANLPLPAILALPLLFAAGMSVMDTTDGVLMVKAYDWAFANPLRKVFYNLTTTGLSVGVALLIGTVELLRVFIGLVHLQGRFFDFVAAFDIGDLGYAIAGMFLVAWGASLLWWKLMRIKEREGDSHRPHFHEHSHGSTLTHSHKHFH
jgi:high-affinity nickel-transport protein